MASADDPDDSRTYEDREQEPIHLNLLFSSKPRRHIIDFFLYDADDTPLYKSDIRDKTGVSRQSVVDHMDTLVEYGVVAEVGEGDGHTRYVPATDSPIYNLLLDVNERLADYYASSQ